MTRGTSSTQPPHNPPDYVDSPAPTQPHQFNPKVTQLVRKSCNAGEHVPPRTLLHSSALLLLSDDLLSQHIASFLTLNSLKAMRCVCRRFHAFVQMPRYTFQYVIGLSGEIPEGVPCEFNQEYYHDSHTRVLVRVTKIPVNLSRKCPRWQHDALKMYDYILQAEIFENLATYIPEITSHVRHMGHKQVECMKEVYDSVFCTRQEAKRGCTKLKFNMAQTKEIIDRHGMSWVLGRTDLKHRFREIICWDLQKDDCKFHNKLFPLAFGLRMGVEHKTLSLRKRFLRNMREHKSPSSKRRQFVMLLLSFIVLHIIFAIVMGTITFFTTPFVGLFYLMVISFYCVVLSYLMFTAVLLLCACNICVDSWVFCCCCAFCCCLW